MQWPFRRPALLAALVPFAAAAAGSCNACKDSGSGTRAEASIEQAEEPTVALPASPKAGQRAAAHSGSAARELVWDYPESPEGPTRVVVSVPAEQTDGVKYPVLVALHGKGEALKGPERGARGWVDDYGMVAAIRRLHAPPLTGADLHGFVSANRLERYNRALREVPYRGIIVVMPYTPVSLAGAQPFEAVVPYGKFLVERVLPRVYRETPAEGTADATGIDGVSLGGRVGLLIGLQLPNAFGAVSVLQAAFDSADAPEIMALAREARVKNPKLGLRLVTSQKDYFLNANRAISRALGAAGIGHELVVVPGPHDYEFNQGPGVIEMLLFHDRVLRGLPAP